MAVMTLRTGFTEYFAVQHPIALAPMGDSAGGALAAAVSNGGGLEPGRRLAFGDRDWLGPADARDRRRAGTARPWGVGFQSWVSRLSPRWSSR